jgi:regulator of replication initiation timing
MDNLRRDVRRLTQDNTACKTKIDQLESDLANLPPDPQSTSGSTGSSSNNAVLTKLADQTTRLSFIQLENAQLKKEIADKESTNVRLLVEVRHLRDKLESMETLSNSNQSLSDSLEILQSELRQREREVSDLKSQLHRRPSQSPDVHIHENLVCHEREVSRAKRTIQRISEHSDDPELPSHSKPHKARPIKHSKPHDRFEDLFVTARDENSALRVELDFLRAKCKELTTLLQAERTKNVSATFQQEEFDRMSREVSRWRTEAISSQSKSVQVSFIAELSHSLHDRLLRWSSSLILKMNIAESKIATELDDLSIKIGKLKTAYLQVRLLQNRKFRLKPPIPSCHDFLSQVNRSVHSIDLMSHAYARAHDYPEEKVPCPAQIVSNSAVLKRFCKHVTSRPW